jgi:hypothetical protein
MTSKTMTAHAPNRAEQLEERKQQRVTWEMVTATANHFHRHSEIVAV